MRLNVVEKKGNIFRIMLEVQNSCKSGSKVWKVLKIFRIIICQVLFGKFIRILGLNSQLCNSCKNHFSLSKLDKYKKCVFKNVDIGEKLHKI